MKPSVALAAVTAAAALALPAGASAASLTLGASCVRDGAGPVDITLAGFPPSGLVRLLNNQDLIDVIQVGEDGGFVGRFPPFSNGDLQKQSSTISAIAEDGTTASAPLTSVDLQVGMVPGKARPSTKVRFAAQGFVEAIGRPLYAHYTRAVSETNHKLVKTVKLGTVQGPCGTLTTAKIAQLPLKKPRSGVYVVQFDADPVFRLQQGVHVERSVFVAPKRRS